MVSSGLATDFGLVAVAGFAATGGSDVTEGAGVASGVITGAAGIGVMGRCVGIMEASADKSVVTLARSFRPIHMFL
jgi:hypothetical protein